METGRAYEWSVDIYGIDANEAGKVMEGLEKTVGLTKKSLVDASRPEDAPLHKAFEWDDSCPDRFYAHFMKKMTGKAIMKNIKTNFSKQILIIAVALLIALPVRVYQYLHVIDGTTGFYNTWSNPTVFGLYGLCALVIILVVALSLKNSKKTIYAMPVGKKTSVGIASLAAAIAFLVESGYNAYRVFVTSNARTTKQAKQYDF